MSHAEALEKHEEERRKLWRDIAVAVAGCDAATSKTAPASWANKVLSDFDEKFPAPVQKMDK